MIITLVSASLDLIILIGSALIILNIKSKIGKIQIEKIIHSDKFDVSYKNSAKAFWIFIFFIKLITLYKTPSPDFFDIINLFLLTLLCAIFLLHSHGSNIILLNDEIIYFNSFGVMKKIKYTNLAGAKSNLVENFGKGIVISNASYRIKIPWHYIYADKTAKIIEEKSRSIGQRSW